MEIPVTRRPSRPSYLDLVYGNFAQSGVFRERYLDRQRLVEIMGLSIRTIDRFVVLGMPSATLGLRVRRFLPSQAIAWAEQHAEVVQ